MSTTPPAPRWALGLEHEAPVPEAPVTPVPEVPVPEAPVTPVPEAPVPEAPVIPVPEAEPVITISLAVPATDPGTLSYNEDRGFVSTFNGGAYIGVFDGHGDYGAEAATVASQIARGNPRSAPAQLMELLDRSVFYRILRETSKIRGLEVVDVEGAIYVAENGNILCPYRRGQPIRGGTTATLLHIHANGSLRCAHVGDSEAFYWDSDTDPGTPLVSDHSANNPEEYARIHSSHPDTRFEFNGRGTRSYRPVFVNRSDGSWALNPKGGYVHADVRGNWSTYVCASDGSESLAMTRVLGDFNMKLHGVTNTPSVHKAPPPARGTVRAIVVATDGLWDSVQYTEVRDLVRRPDLLGNAEAATAALLQFALEKGAENFNGYIDNILVTVTYVKSE